MKKKVLFFGDFGIDDAIALIYAHLSNQIEIVGIIADYGNAARRTTVRNANYLLGLLGMKDIPVITGAERPMTGKAPQFFPEVHGPEGLGPIVPEMAALPPRENFYEVIDVIERYKDELIIVNTGRLTSLATLFISYADLMRHVRACYIMGGAFLVPGNVTPVAEANFAGDPVAANIVMRYAENVFLFPLNATMKAIVTPDMLNYIHAKGKTKLVKPLLDFYYEFYKKNYPFIQGSPIHDALAMSAVINDRMFKYACLPVQVVTAEGMAEGQSIADFRVSNPAWNKEPCHRIALDFQYEQFYSDFMSVMAGC